MDHAHIRAYFLAIVTTLLTVLAVFMFRPFLVTVGLAAVFAVIFTPLHARLKKARFPDALAALATILIGAICIVVPLSFLGTQLFSEAQDVYGTLSDPGSAARIQGALSSAGRSIGRSVPGSQAYIDSLSTNLSAYVRQGLSWSLGHAGAIFSGTLGFLLQLFIFIMTLYYFLKEGPRVARAIERFSPLAPSETEALTSRLKQTISSVVKGTFFIALIQGALTAVGFLIFGIPNAVLWGAIAVIGALIPSIGTALVLVPGVLYLLFIGHTGTAIGLAIYGFVGVGTVDNFLRPYLMAGTARIHPLLVLLSVLGGIAFFGAGGLFLGPLVVSLLLGLLSIYTPAKAGA